LLNQANPTIGDLLVLEYFGVRQYEGKIQSRAQRIEASRSVATRCKSHENNNKVHTYLMKAFICIMYIQGLVAVTFYTGVRAQALTIRGEQQTLNMLTCFR